MVLLDGLCSWSDSVISSHLLSLLLGSVLVLPCESSKFSSSERFLNISSDQTSGSGSSSSDTSYSPLPSSPFIHCSKWIALPLVPLLALLNCLHLCSIRASICLCDSALSFMYCGVWKMFFVNLVWASRVLHFLGVQGILIVSEHRDTPRMCILFFFFF